MLASVTVPNELNACVRCASDGVMVCDVRTKRYTSRHTPHDTYTSLVIHCNTTRYDTTRPNEPNQPQQRPPHRQSVQVSVRLVVVRRRVRPAAAVRAG